MTSPVRVKICCIASIDEARVAISAGADALGLVSAMPSGPGPIADHDIARIASAVPPPIATFLLTATVDPATIAAQVRNAGVNAVQLVDALAPGGLAALRAYLPSAVKIVQVIHVIGPESVDEAVAVAPLVDALLLDSGNPNLAVKELGGTGRRHDWQVSRAIRDAVAVPIFLAGGLRSENVAEAIATVAPFGLDLCTGVRTDNRLDCEKLDKFMAAVAKENS